MFVASIKSIKNNIPETSFWFVFIMFSKRACFDFDPIEIIIYLGPNKDFK